VNTVFLVYKNLGGKKVKTIRKKANAASIVITLVLVLTIVTPAFAQLDPSYAFVAVSPKTVGLGETILVMGWTSPMPILIGTDLSGFGQGRPRHNYTFTFTDPDGSTDTVIGGPSFGDGTVFFTYVPNKRGVWEVTLYWPGNEIYAASTSPPLNFTVQDEPLPEWPASPLPTEWWTRPVYTDNREWYQYLSDWRQSGYNATGGSWNPYTTGPDTAHILWTRQNTFGGIRGGDFGDWAYQGGGPSPVVMGGLAYLSMADGIHCIDIYTGEELWAKDIPGSKYYVAPSPPDYANLAQAETPPTIYSVVGDHVELYDAFTGGLKQVLTGPSGISAYVSPFFIWFDRASGNMTIWDPNIRNLFVSADFPGDFPIKIIKEIPYTESPSYYVGGTSFYGVESAGFYGVDHWGGVGVGRNAMFAINLTTAEVLWDNSAILDSTYMRSGHCVGYGKYFYNDLNMKWHAVDIYTGDEVWTSEPAEYPWGTFWAYNSATGNGKLYGQSYDGHVYAFDVDTGKIVWKFYSGDAGTETPYGTWPFWGAISASCGRVYASTSEHTPSQPRLRGQKLFCIDDDTGQEIWHISGSHGGMVLADKMLFTTGETDGKLYCFAKGPTATTVSASPKILVDGSSVLIEGTILDQSPGQKDTPCVSPESMTAWMEYLHMQKPCPDATGVPVDLRAMRSDGSIIDIDTVTSDLKGHFTYKWTPPTDDTYVITATFAGDDSYWGSWAATGLGVDPAPEVEPEPEPEEEPAYNTIDLAIIAAVIVAIVIGIVNLYALRKRR
jgi:outer membrane protein assembly factor BamB